MVAQRAAVCLFQSMPTGEKLTDLQNAKTESDGLM